MYRSTTTQPPHSPAAPAAPETGPLSADHHQALAEARQRRKKISRANHLAAFNAWSFAVLAGLSVCFAIFNVTSLVGAAVLGGLAWNEFRGKGQLKRLDPQGPVTLGYNQCLFCLAIAAYCGYEIFNALFGPGPYAEEMASSPELAQMLEPIAGMIQTASVIGYGLIAVVGVGLQGATAWFYFTRKKWVERYLQGTAAWIVELDRAI